MSDVLMWLEGTALASWTRESPSIWAYPTVLTLHTLGLGVVVGASAVIDLRLLGAARRIPLDSLFPLFRLIAWAFAVNAITGILLFIADATTKGRQPVLYLKLALIGLALWNTLYARRLLGASGDGPTRQARFIAVSSLVLWAGAIAAGRLMAYV